MYNYRDLIVWQKSMDLVESLYKLTSSFPDTEKFGLTSQIRRCAVSIPSNIAEGSGRKSKKAFRSFLEISNGSINELKTQIEISKRIGILKDDDLQNIFKQCDEIQKMTFSLIKKYSDF